MKQSISSNTKDFHRSSEYLKRPSLQKLLLDAMNFPLITVCAGTGYGKTSAVYSFLKDYSANKIWIQLSKKDNTATRFWESFTHVISLGQPEMGKRLLKIGFPDTTEKFSQYETLLDEMIAPAHKYVLVFDDFHLLNNPAVLRFIEFTLQILPHNVTAFILSRTMPDINLTGMMMRERVFTIYESSLRFSEEEVTEYFTRLKLEVTSKDIHDIYKDTQGWAFALNLIGRSLRKEMKYERCMLEATKLSVYKLIESEVFLTISENLQKLLLRISLIDHLSFDLIKLLTDDDSLIKEMEQLHAYIRYDAALNSYVMHHLFLGFLKKMQHMLSDEEKRETYQIAGNWCEEYGYITDALMYYEKSGDWSTILKIAHNFDAFMPYDIAEYILDILKNLPEEETLKNPLFPVMRLKLQTNLGLTDEAFELAKRYAEHYEAQPESKEKHNALAGIYSALGFLRLLTCPYTDEYDFDAYFEKLSVYYDKNTCDILSNLKNQPISAWVTLTKTNREGAPEEYIESLTRSVPHIARVLNGNLYGIDDLARGELCYYRRELQEAELHLKQAQSKAQERNQYDILNRSLYYLMQIAFTQGDFATADKLLKSMKHVLNETGCAIRSATAFDVACGTYYLSLNQPHKIPDWLKGDFRPFTHPAFIDNYINLVKAKYHSQTQQYSTLLAFIENTRQQQVLLFSNIEFKVLNALALYQFKKRSEAIAALCDAYFLAEPNKIIMPFIQYRKDMRTLTGAALKDADCPIPEKWLMDINRKSSALAKKQTHMISEYMIANNLNKEMTLTKRETKILKELMQGLSRSEIAASQNISTNTVKMIINIIYDKLHASNLVDTIRIATERKLI